MKKAIASLIFLIIITQSYSQNFSWALSYEGAEEDIGHDLLIDASNNIFTVGTFQTSVNFGDTPNDSLRSNGSYDIFIQKTNSEGEHLWSKSMGGEDWDKGKRILLDKNDNLLVGGTFRATVDFDPSNNYKFLDNEDYMPDQFLLNLNKDGEFIWVNHMINGEMKDIVLDEEGNIYVVGEIREEIAFEIDGQLHSASEEYITTSYIQKIDSEGSNIWVKTFGGSGESIRIDSNGNIYCAGIFYNTSDFDPSTESFIIPSVGECDIFLMKLNEEGAFLWAKNFGGPGHNFSPLVEVRSDDQIYLTGEFSSYSFISLLNNSGELIWEKKLEKNEVDGYCAISDITVDSNDHLYLTGILMGAVDFDPSNEFMILSSNSYVDGESDAFVAHYTNDGILVWAQQIKGDESGIRVESLELNSKNNLILMGAFNQTLDISSDDFSFYTQTDEDYDIFIAEILNAAIYKGQKN